MLLLSPMFLQTLVFLASLAQVDASRLYHHTCDAVYTVVTPSPGAEPVTVTRQGQPIYTYVADHVDCYGGDCSTEYSTKSYDWYSTIYQGQQITEGAQSVTFLTRTIYGNPQFEVCPTAGVYVLNPTLTTTVSAPTTLFYAQPATILHICPFSDFYKYSTAINQEQLAELEYDSCKCVDGICACHIEAQTLSVHEVVSVGQVPLTIDETISSNGEFIFHKGDLHITLTIKNAPTQVQISTTVTTTKTRTITKTKTTTKNLTTTKTFKQVATATVTATPARRFVLSIRITSVKGRQVKRQSQIRFVGIRNSVISLVDQSEATQLELVDGQITDGGDRHFAFVDGRLQFVKSGGISRTFSFDSDTVLQWQNSAFSGGRAQFCSSNSVLNLISSQSNNCQPAQLFISATSSSSATTSSSSSRLTSTSTSRTSIVSSSSTLSFSSSSSSIPHTSTSSISQSTSTSSSSTTSLGSSNISPSESSTSSTISSSTSSISSSSTSSSSIASTTPVVSDTTTSGSSIASSSSSSSSTLASTESSTPSSTSSSTSSTASSSSSSSSTSSSSITSSSTSTSDATSTTNTTSTTSTSSSTNSSSSSSTSTTSTSTSQTSSSPTPTNNPQPQPQPTTTTTTISTTRTGPGFTSTVTGSDGIVTVIDYFQAITTVYTTSGDAGYTSTITGSDNTVTVLVDSAESYSTYYTTTGLTSATTTTSGTDGYATVVIVVPTTTQTTTITTTVTYGLTGSTVYTTVADNTVIELIEVPSTSTFISTTTTGQTSFTTFTTGTDGVVTELIIVPSTSTFTTTATNGQVSYTSYVTGTDGVVTEVIGVPSTSTFTTTTTTGPTSYTSYTTGTDGIVTEIIGVPSTSTVTTTITSGPSSFTTFATGTDGVVTEIIDRPTTSSSRVTTTTTIDASTLQSGDCLSDNGGKHPLLLDLSTTTTTDYSPSNNSVEECSLLCAESGYSYSGTEQGTKCYCGNTIYSYYAGNMMDADYFSSGVQVDKSFCNTPCSNSSMEKCGGTGYLSYAKAYNPTQLPICLKIRSLEKRGKVLARRHLNFVRKYPTIMEKWYRLEDEVIRQRIKRHRDPRYHLYKERVKWMGEKVNDMYDLHSRVSETFWGSYDVAMEGVMMDDGDTGNSTLP